MFGLIADTPPAPPAELAALQDMQPRRNGAEDGIPPLRREMLRESAVGVGARGGLAWRTRLIQENLGKMETSLDRIFRFDALLLGHHVLPPVLSEGRSVYTLASPTEVRESDRVYRIEAQARFVSAAPNWRDYLLRSYPGDSNLGAAALPKTGAEREAWRDWVTQGWAQGVAQADAIFQEDVNRLRRDFEGMARYHSLKVQGMVGEPLVATANLGITGSANDMNVGDTVYRITVKPAMQLDSKKWRPVVIAGQDPAAPARPISTRDDGATQDDLGLRDGEKRAKSRRKHHHG